VDSQGKNDYLREKAMLKRMADWFAEAAAK
jgi:hypothetical protein